MISVIVPVYKSEKYLNKCVQSILDQQYSDLELLLVDDGSPDNSGRLCDAWAIKDSRVRVIHKQNGGVCSARNAGLDAATGEYIAFLDSDDWIEPEMYSSMMEKIIEFDCDAVLCDCVKDQSGHSELYTHPIRSGFYDREALKREYFPHLLMMEHVEYPATISNCSLLFRRELMEDVRYLVGVRYSEDLLFGAEIMYRAQSFYYMKGQAFYHYVMNPNSVTNQFVPDKWKDYRRLHEGIRSRFGSCTDFDFSRQIDLCLLFFLYNAVGDLYTAPLSRREKKRMILGILEDMQVRAMFGRLNISTIPISKKQKILTWIYRRRVGISVLIHYYGGTH